MAKIIKNIILYHDHCDDGFGAAWAAWKKFGQKAKYIGVTIENPPPDGLDGKNVYILDFCYLPKEIKQLLKKTRRLVVVDHHFSNQKTVKLVPEHTFSLDYSGAYLAWQYFHPHLKIPKLIKHIDDVDLWKWKLPHSQEISSFLRSYQRDFKTWNKIVKGLNNAKQLRKFIAEGNAILRADREKIDHAVDSAELVEFCGYKTLAANSFHLVSYIGNALYKKLPPIAIIWSKRKSFTVVSLRSNGKVDVSKLAKNFGGGGHKVSAAFRLKQGQKLPWKAISGKIT
ncbi:MAG: hypothetical protein HYS51_02190 [Candidatus Zambryskibacteria bacterium]|nr:hypothetical protein [Candidatus Zambryskibacteria bacterium]